MILNIDNREPKEIIDYLNFFNENSKNKITMNVTTLDLGDYIFYDEKNEKNILIIERKSLNDLEASIKDGRYNEQSFRLNEANIENHNIYYLIEGSIINYKNKAFKNTLYSSLFSLSYYKGFSVFNSLNMRETAEIIYAFVNKILREKDRSGYYNIKNIKNNELINNLGDLSNNSLITIPNLENNYAKVVKPTKKENITNDNINVIMLMQIPGVSFQTANAIMREYKTIKNLILMLEKDENILDSLKNENNNRKINKNIINSIKNYLLIKDN
jgi:ERCC4-type nuclease